MDKRTRTDYLTFVRNTFRWLDYYQDFTEHLESSYRRIRVTEEYFRLIACERSQSIPGKFDKSTYRRSLNSSPASEFTVANDKMSM